MPLFENFNFPLNWTNEKAKGEIAEMAFQLKATAVGLSVSKPYGDNQPFDFIVSCLRTGSLRVQVRSAWTFRKFSFVVKLRRSPGPRGPGDGYDFLVVYIPPFDAWYIVPTDALRGRSAFFNPGGKNPRGRLEGFRDAWHFLTGDHADDHRLIGLTIHAAAEPAPQPVVLVKDYADCP